MRFLIPFICALIATTNTHASTLEQRLVTLFKELCVSQSWENMAANGEKLARVKSWKSKDIERGPHGHSGPHGPWGYAPPQAWTFDEPGTKQAAVTYSIMEPHYPGVLHNYCMVIFEANSVDKEAFEELRKRVPPEVTRQFGTAIVLRDPEKEPVLVKTSQWHFTAPGKTEPNCARTITFPSNYAGKGNHLVLFITEYAYPDDRKWDYTRFLTWCSYTYLDVRDYWDRREKEAKEAK